LDITYFDDLPESAWTHLGELKWNDPLAQPPDYSKARRWRPLHELIEERTGIPWSLRG
jgi:hypothetical protein